MNTFFTYPSPMDTPASFPNFNQSQPFPFYQGLQNSPPLLHQHLDLPNSVPVPCASPFPSNVTSILHPLGQQQQGERKISLRELELQAQLRGTQAALQGKTTQLELAIKNNGKLTTDLQIIHRCVEKEGIRSLHERLNSTNQELHSARYGLKESRENLIEKTRELETLKTQLDELELSIKNAKQEIESIKLELTSTKQQKELVQRTNTAYLQELQMIKKENEGLKMQVEQQGVKILKQQAIIDEYTQRQEKLLDNTLLILNTLTKKPIEDLQKRYSKDESTPDMKKYISLAIAVRNKCTEEMQAKLAASRQLRAF